jgi:hypothetical protein
LVIESDIDLGEDKRKAASRTSHSAEATPNMDLVRRGLAIAQDPKHTTWISPLLILGDAALSFLIVRKIACKCRESNCPTLAVCGWNSRMFN